MTHLAWHQRLMSNSLDDASPFYLAAHIALDQLNAKSLAGILDNLADAAPAIPYGINWIGALGSFDSEGRYTPPTESCGLTCATFVSEVLSGAGLDAVLPDTWQPRPDDVAWGEFICAQLERTRSVSRAHVENVRKHIGALRLRPEEICGAGAVPHASWPLAFDPCLELARGALRSLEAALGTNEIKPLD